MLHSGLKTQKPEIGTQGPTRYLYVLCSIFCILGFIPFATHAANTDGIDILRTLPDGLIIQFQMPELEIDTRNINGQTFQVLSFKGCSFTHEVGKAKIPTKVISLGIPTESDPQVSVLDSESDLLTNYKLYPVEKSVTRREDVDSLSELSPGDASPSGIHYTVGTEFVLDQKFYRDTGLYPPALVEIQPTGYVRQQRVARLEIHPIQYIPSTGQLKIHRKLEIKVTFPLAGSEAQYSDVGVYAAPGLQISVPNSHNSESVFEDLYHDSLLNYEQARNWRKPRPRMAYSLAPSLDSEVSYKITVEENGVYKLDHSYLTRVGIDPSVIDPRKIEVRSGGERVPIYVEGYKDGRFDPGDYIEFYGRKMDSIYTDANVYWLSWGGAGIPNMMAIKDGKPKAQELIPPVAFLDTERWEENYHYDPLKKVTTETADHFFWKGMRGQDPQNDQLASPIPLNLPFRAYNISNPYTLRVGFQGITFSRGANTHIMDITLNGEGQKVQWEGQIEYISEYSSSQINLKRYNWFYLNCLDNNNTLEKYTIDPTSPKWDLYLNWMEIDYWREFRADKNRLEFSTETVPPVTKTVQYKIEEFSTPDIEIFQIDRLGAIAKIINPKVEKGATSYTVTFEDKVEQPTRYFVASSISLMRPTSIVKEQPSTLHDPAHRLDYIMITHKDFRESTERLAEFRKQQGLDVIVVDIEDVYDEFSYGVFDPKAIKRFLRYAYSSWDKSPVYVLLVGDAHWDYKYVFHENYLRYANYPRIYVPTYHAHSEPYGQAALDHRFVTVSGDDKLPDMFIGRLPVENLAEADATVDKIIEYEQRPRRELWQSRIVLVSDDKKSKSGDEVFQESREELADDYIPVGYEVVEIYLENMEPYIARDMINKEINSTNKGTIILEYAGHGGAHSWAHEFIFAVEDVRKAQNHDRYPFIITTTCENGYFDNPTGGNKSIIEEFIIKPDAGAVASLSATRLTFGQGNATFDKILYPKMFGEKPPILGKIINEAKVDFINLGIATWTPSAEQYTLFGDPATTLALPKLDIECEVTNSSVDSSKKLELQPGSIKRMKENPLTGEKELVTDTGFNAQMQISVVYPNNLDEIKSNDLPAQSSNIRIWSGKFDKVQLPIPSGVIPGEGRLRCYASDGNLSAIGGVQFWIRKPVIEYHSSRFINDESLQIHAAVVDNLGGAGIRSVTCDWQNTETWKTNTDVPLIPGDAPPDAPEVEGIWYVIEDNIPLSRPGTSINYKVKVIDTEGLEDISDLTKIQIPIGVNLAISRRQISQSPIISYSYSQEESSWILSAPVENNGGKAVKKPVAVYFFEGNPDRNRDGMIDSSAEVLGHVVIEPEQWEPGDEAIQVAMATIKLSERLYSGFHQIFVWINPKTNRLEDPAPVERVEDADKTDDSSSRLFPINEFLVGKGNEATVSQSLDGVLSMVIPPDSVDETVMSISRSEAPESRSEQPDLSIAPIPEYGLDGDGFKIQLASGVVSLQKEAQIDVRFDLMGTRELAKESKGLAEKDEIQLSAAEKEWIELASKEEAEKLGVYSWQEELGVWRYIPSSLLVDEKSGDIIQEPYITLPMGENAPGAQIDYTSIVADEVITPLGDWVIFFLDSETYRLYLRRQGMTAYEIISSGKVDKIYYDSEIGLRMMITDTEKRFRFGDSFKFETYQDIDGAIKIQSLRDYNKGNGTTRVTVMNENIFNQVSYTAGQWAIFFISPDRFEIHSSLGIPIKNAFGAAITGEIGKEVMVSTIGVAIEIHEGRWPFELGDKYVFKTLFTGTVRAQINRLGTIALMHSNDLMPPSIQLWVGGHIPQSGIVIPPRPEISILLSDTNGVDTDSFSFIMSVDDRDFYPVPTKDYIFSERGGTNSFTNVPVFYSPILNIGKYKYRIAVMDFNGNGVNNGDYLEFMFLVEEQPDLEPPVISISADGQPLINGQVFPSSPELVISIDDNNALDEPGISFSFARADEPLEPLEKTEYAMTLSDDSGNAASAVITYAPHLMNGEYAVQAMAIDTSENIAYLVPPEAEPLMFRVEEEVELESVMNAPNPFSDTTAFSYSLTQAADKVTIKIYTLRGRLVRTLEQNLPRWQYNEEFWDGRDEEGNKLASGTYFYRFIVDSGNKKIEKIGKLAIIR